MKSILLHGFNAHLLPFKSTFRFYFWTKYVVFEKKWCKWLFVQQKNSFSFEIWGNKSEINFYETFMQFSYQIFLKKEFWGREKRHILYICFSFFEIFILKIRLIASTIWHINLNTVVRLLSMCKLLKRSVFFFTQI